MTEATGGPRGGRRRAVAVLLAALFPLGACGSDAGEDTSANDPSTTGTPSTSASVPAGAPECADVWKDGGTIPRTYQGCVEDGTYVKRDAIACESGQFLIRYDDRFWGADGGKVHEVDASLEEDRDYRAATRVCTA